MTSLTKRLSEAGKFILSVGKNFSKHENSLRAASLAYYGLFSLFPLLLFLLYLSSEVLATSGARQVLSDYLNRVLPINTASLEAAIAQTLSVRGSIGVISAIGLLWSGSAVFGVLEAALNVIWNGHPSPFWRRRAVATASVLVLSLLFAASLTVGPLTSWIFAGLGATLQYWLSKLVGLGLIVLICFLLFRLFPQRRIAWKPALAGSALAGFLIAASQYFFAWYLSSAFVNYGYIYGSLAWIISLALWTYVVSVLFFFGAEFGALLEQREAL